MQEELQSVRVSLTSSPRCKRATACYPWVYLALKNLNVPWWLLAGSLRLRCRLVLPNLLSVLQWNISLRIRGIRLIRFGRVLQSFVSRGLLSLGKVGTSSILFLFKTIRRKRLFYLYVVYCLERIELLLGYWFLSKTLNSRNSYGLICIPRRAVTAPFLLEVAIMIIWDGFRLDHILLEAEIASASRELDLRWLSLLLWVIQRLVAAFVDLTWYRKMLFRVYSLHRKISFAWHFPNDKRLLNSLNLIFNL